MIIGSHFVPLDGKFLLIALAMDNIKCENVSNAHKCPLNNGVSIVQKLVVKLSNTSTKLDNVFATGGNNIVEVFESLTNRFLNDGHTVV